MVSQYFTDHPDFIVRITEIGEEIFNGRVEDSANLFVGYRLGLEALAHAYWDEVTQFGWVTPEASKPCCEELFESMITHSAFPDEGGSDRLFKMVKEAYQHRQPWINQSPGAEALDFRLSALTNRNQRSFP